MNQRKSKERKQLKQSRKMEINDCYENSTCMSTDSWRTEVGSCSEEFQPYQCSFVSEETEEMEFEKWFNNTNCKREQTEDNIISQKQGSEIDEPSSSNLESSQDSLEQIEKLTLITLDGQTAIIDEKLLPYIFYFNFDALVHIKLSDTDVSPIARIIYDFVVDRVIGCANYSRFSKFKNRMKFEEKVKCLFRIFEYRYAQEEGKTLIKHRNFKREKQEEFFHRDEVRNNFLQYTFEGLLNKKRENFKRIEEIQKKIEKCLSLGWKDPQKAQTYFEMVIKRKQVPWSDHMFMDMVEFSRKLYLRYVPGKDMQRILRNDVQASRVWDMTDDPIFHELEKKEVLKEECLISYESDE